MTFFLSAIFMATVVWASARYHTLWVQRPRLTNHKVRTHGERG